MIIVRHQAGSTAPRDARYALVGHYGEPTGLAVWLRSGMPFPPPPDEVRLDPPLWYVEMTEAAVTQIAA
jgi:hypothetical protein